MAHIAAQIGRSLMHWGVFAAALVTLMILFAGKDWRFELFSHFRLQFAVGLLLFSIPFIILRRWKLLTVIVLCLLPQLFALSWHYLPFGKDDRAAEGPELKVMAFNVLSGNREHQAVRALITREDPDLILLSEIHSRWRDELAPLESRYPYSAAQVREDNFGMLLLSKFPILQEQFILNADIVTPLLVAKLAWGESEITFIGVHPLTPLSREGAHSRRATFASISQIAEDTSNELLIVAGDFNCSSYSPAIQDLQKNLRDAARGRGNAITWHALTPLLGIPIDHILYRDSLVCTQFRIGPKGGSDHSAVLATFRKADPSSPSQ